MRPFPVSLSNSSAQCASRFQRVGLGLGAQKYQVVFLFQDEKTFRNFVDKGWQADASAQASAGTAGVGAQTGFVNGIAIYQVNETGLMARADIAGTKYWKNKKLN